MWSWLILIRILFLNYSNYLLTASENFAFEKLCTSKLDKQTLKLKELLKRICKHCQFPKNWSKQNIENCVTLRILLQIYNVQSCRWKLKMFLKKMCWRIFICWFRCKERGFLVWNFKNNSGKALFLQRIHSVRF